VEIMPSKYRLRPLFAPFIRWIARGCIKIHITPNGATWIMLFWAVFAAVGFWLTGCFLFLTIGIFLTGIMDGVDGAIARLSNRSSAFGGFFDSTMDRVSEGIIFLGIAGGWWTHYQFEVVWDSILFWTLVVFSLLISYTRTRCEGILQSSPSDSPDSACVDTNIGALGRSERLFYLVLLSLIATFTPILVFRIGLWILNACLLLMVSYRILRYRKFLNSAG
jgi:CDP-diacylglycerol--glycerol-3-phosphate 3-phosphatidyltransferase